MGGCLSNNHGLNILAKPNARTQYSQLLGWVSIQVPMRTLITMRCGLLDEVRQPEGHAPDCSVTDCNGSLKGSFR